MQKHKTYNTRDSPVVTHPSTSLAIACLSMGERTGSRVFRRLWPYVTDTDKEIFMNHDPSQSGQVTMLMSVRDMRCCGAVG